MEILGVKTDGEYKAAEYLFESTKMNPEKHSSTLIRLALSPSYLSHISITSLTASQNVLYHLITPTIASYIIANQSDEVHNNDFNTEVARVLAVRRIRDCGGGLPFPENADDPENVWPHSLHETSITLNRCIRDDPLAPTPPSKLSSTPLSNPTHSSHRDHHPQRTPDNNKRPSSSSAFSVPEDPRLIGHVIFEQATQKITP